MAKGVDRAVPFKKLDELKALHDLGYTFVGRYLTKNSKHWKALTRQEAKLITSVGMYVVCVYQDENNRADYFSYLQGKIDASRASERAKEVGAPDDAVIYFSVDYNTTTKTISPVIEYFKGIRDAMKDEEYRLGVYGSYNTVEKVTAIVKEINFKWQTVAWSKNKVCDYNLYQHKIDTVIPENKKMFGYDLNLSNGAGGGWKLTEG